MNRLLLTSLLALTIAGAYSIRGETSFSQPTDWSLRRATSSKSSVSGTCSSERVYVLADSVARFLRDQNNCIPWDYPEDYCFARAHAAYLLTRKAFGVELGKLYLYPQQQTAEINIRVRLPEYALYDSARWNGHVAVFLADGRDTLVIDPALTVAPVPKAIYLQKLGVDPRTFAVTSGPGREYCSVCQTKFNYSGQEAQETTQRALYENRLRRAVFVKETEIERSYPACTRPLPTE